ncbi:DUF3975 family protein [Bacillus pacificus]|nr:DUF3975 family protein [Bacillus pacificus]
MGVSKISFHIIESLFHKIVSILTFLALKQSCSLKTEYI